MDKPVVSIVLPVYNHAQLLPKALDSIATQTFKDFEFLCVDDGCTDGSNAILKTAVASGKVDRAVFHGKNRGAAEAINTGADYAKGLHWTWISADNTMDPDWLETLVDSMRPDVGVVYSAYNRFGGALTGKQGEPYGREVCWELDYRIVYLDEELCQYYAGPDRSSVRDAHEYDALKWQEEARSRRGLSA